jgi:hypothetical protein
VAFKQGLQALGWTDGRNVHIDYRFGSADLDLARKYAAELVGLTPDVILAIAHWYLRALREQTSTIPIVFALVVDPVGEGFIKSLAQPGGNITWLGRISAMPGGGLLAATGRGLAGKLETNKVTKKQSSAIIAADVRRFPYLINTDEVFGTHTSQP